MTLLDTISDILVQKVSKCVFAVVRQPVGQHNGVNASGAGGGDTIES